MGPDFRAQVMMIAGIIILVAIPIVLLVLVCRDVGRIAKLPLSKRPTGKSFLIASAIAYILFKFGGAYMKGTSESDQANTRLEYAFKLMAQSDEIKKCVKRHDTGEFKTSVALYDNCEKPFIRQIFAKAGVQHEQSLDTISGEFLEIATKDDNGKSLSKEGSEEFAKKLYGVIVHDLSEL